MKLVNAEIKSKKELATRLMAGEVFWSNNEYKVYYEDVGGRSSPFRFGNSELSFCWADYATLQKEVIWYENIEKPVLCWCSDSEDYATQENGHLLLVKSYTRAGTSDYPFDTEEDQWKYATPVSQEEASQWVVG